MTHDQTEALAISDRIIVMNQARIAQDGAPRALYESPADRFVVNFMGEASILPVEIGAVEGDTAIVRFGEATLSLPRRGLEIGKAELAIRPHAVRLSRNIDTGGAVPGIIRRAVYGGDHMEYDVAITGFEEPVFVIDTNMAATMLEGRVVGVELLPSGLSLLPTGSPLLRD